MKNKTSLVLQKLMTLNNIKNASQLADRTGGHRGTLGNVLLGKTTPSKKTIELLSKFFRVSEDYIVTGNEVYLEENKEEENSKPTAKEINRFLEILISHREEYENTEAFQLIEKQIIEKERNRVAREEMIKKLQSRK